MKRYIKYFALLLVCVSVLFSLCSCFTSSVTYTEWELSANETEISNGKDTYTAYINPEFTAYWQHGEEATYYYMNTVDSAISDESASIYGSIMEDGIIILHIYDNMTGNIVGMQTYATNEGKAVLDKIGTPILDTECIAYDSLKNREGDLTEEMVSLIDGLRKSNAIRVEKTDYELEELDYIQIKDRALGGFFEHVIGGFYFDRAEIYYLDGAPSAAGGSNSLIKLSQVEREILSAYIDDSIYRYPPYTNEFEEGVYTDNTDRFIEIARAILLTTVFILGIALAIVPILFSLWLLKRRAWKFKLTDYILLISGGIWLISGIVTFIILLF